VSGLCLHTRGKTLASRFQRWAGDRGDASWNLRVDGGCFVCQ
jgi:hypothetical protein